MLPTKYVLLFSVTACLLFSGCRSESNSEDERQPVILGKLELSDGWARPASQGDTGGAYLTIANGTASDDTLLNISSETAEATELHETYENEDGTVEMRPAGKQVIKAGDELIMKPGGLHIMLMNLNRQLAAGDSLTLALQFARVGTKKITVPVKIQK